MTDSRQQTVQLTEPVTSHFAMISPGDHYTCNSYFHLPKQFWEALINRTYRLRVCLFVEYEDAFGKKRTLRSDFANEAFDEPFSFIEGSRFAD